jgi:hypothetical protein
MMQQPITHNLLATDARRFSGLDGGSKFSDSLHPFQKGLGTGMTGGFAAEKATQASDQARHLTQGG